MGADGTRGPKPYTQRRASTVFLRVPSAEWAAVKYGHKTEFRAACRKHSPLWNVATPTPVVTYSVSRAHGYRSALMVLEDVWREPLGAITPESVAAEGYATFAEFRSAWCAREKRWFPPLRMTTVYRVRPWVPDDNRDMAEVLLGRLYGEFLQPVS